MASCPAPFGAIDANIETMERILDAPEARGASLVCFPECSLTGYAPCHDALGLADEVPGALTRRVGRACAARGIAVIAGLVERAAGSFYITQVAVGPEGVIGSYRKMHLSPGEKPFFAAGSDAPLMSWKGFSFGIGLCYDAHFPELATLYALSGADLVVYPHASPPPETAEEKMARWLRYLPARAYDNGVYVGACNQSGENGRGMTFRGVSIVIDPKGGTLSSSLGDDAAVAAADVGREVIERVRASGMGYFLKGRRPDAYGALGK